MSGIASNMQVRYKADPTTVGWVIGVSGDSARVFIDGAVKLVPVAELEPAPESDGDDPGRVQDRSDATQT